MRVDAEETSGPVWATDDDPRITRVGRLLRRTRLDEVPQFWNVLRGEMSIVGPRPERPTFVRRLRDEIAGYPLRQQVPPGITGWAQVNGRNTISWEEKFKLDLWYIDHYSFCLDIKILWMTVSRVFRSEGINQKGVATMDKFSGSPNRR